MTPERHARVSELFAAALEKPEGDRAAFLAKACDGDDELRAEVESLLGHRDQAEVLDAPVVARSWIGEALATGEHGGGSKGGPGADESTEPGWDSELLDRLREQRSSDARFRQDGELAQGGMGRILKVWDPTIRRPLAMKVMHQSPVAQAAGGATLLRFLEEAQIAGQLEHPGVVPVHELGMDQDGHVFFTMSLVRGEDLSEVFEKVREGRDGWSVTRVLGVLLRVCETMAYAHSKGVVHRDLKPGNVRVGRFGEVYVMDWGIARVRGREDRHDLRFSAPATASLHTERSHPEGADSGPLCTMDGKVVGTPYYMSLEQAEGRVEEIGPRSDVYAIGAMLYELLAGQRPYARPGTRISAHTVLAAVIDHPPTPLREMCADVPSELVSIVEKAMARDHGQRYANTVELADDLRAYLEDRVVKAHAVGPLAELRKWFHRNRRTALSLSAAIVVAFGLTTALAIQQGRHNVALSAVNGSLRTARQEAESNLVAYERLADINELARLKTVAKELWPAWPAHEESYRQWLREAEDLTARLPLHRAFLATTLADDTSEDLGPNSASSSPATAPAAPNTVRAKERDELRSASTLPSRDRWLPDLLTTFIAELEEFADGATDDGVHDIKQRLAWSQAVDHRTYDEHELIWEDALTELAFDERFADVEIDVQRGLVPLGPDPDSGLWEFAVLGTGSLPERDGTGELLLEEESGVVLVLVPPADTTMGAQDTDPAAPHYDQRSVDARPLHDVPLGAFFIGKFEVTQWQWEKLMGDRPSFFPRKGRTEFPLGEPDWKLLPVEQVSHIAAQAAMRRVGLMLPTEAQWEYAARAGSTERWWCGQEASRIPQMNAGNLFEQLGQSVRGDDLWGAGESWRDQHGEMAPIGRYTANDFGLHDTIGNVLEWCADWHGSYELPVRTGDGLRDVPSEGQGHRVARGGAFSSNASAARSSYRDRNTPDHKNFNLGFRAARPLQPPP